MSFFFRTFAVKIVVITLNLIKMEPIRFYAGQENGVIVEKDNFSQSVFYDKYQQALTIFSRIWESKNSDISNIIAICGDRGEGKTSFLRTIRNLLADDIIYKKAQEEGLQICNNFKSPNIHALDVIDPAFFDSKHNLIELLLGKMYGKLKDQIKTDENSLVSFDKTKLLQQFDKVKKCLSIIRKQSGESVYDRLEELDQLAAGMQLKDELDKLFEAYCKFYGAQRLLICIDDLDLNMSEGYRMAEEIRKYLCNHERCIILVALKVEQMNEVIASYLRENTNEYIIDNNSVYEMANHYITKFLPLGHRVWMPSGNEITEREVIIIDRDGNKHKFGAVKEAVVKLIFQKTRYVFVNGRALSPIVPVNLRNLRHLLGLLFDMPPAKDDKNRDNVENKRIFKHYFYHKWVECLSSKDYKFVSELVTINDYSVINKDVVTYLAYKFPKEQVVREEDNNSANKTKVDSPSDILLQNILDFRNTMYNISIGDVFYVMQRLDQTPTNINTSNLIFFIRSFYAIKLYETYDIISLDEEHLFMKEKDNVSSIYKYDLALQQLNMMQRLINGSYFTYIPGELLPTAKKIARDIRVIEGKNLKQLFERLKTLTEMDNRDEEFYSILHLCEFFALTTTHPVKNSTINVVESLDRRQSEILTLKTTDSESKNWIFDVMSIFYNVINYQMAYEKFSIYYSGFYNLVSSVETDSLLNKMLVCCEKNEEGRGESKLNKRIHGLISDAAVRSDIVLMAIMDAAKQNRNKHRKGSNVDNIRFLYNAIRSIKITLYEPSEKNSEKDENLENHDPIPFKYLEPIISYLDESIDIREFDVVYGLKSDLQQDIDFEND